jgi:phosphoribosylformylglycinamidine synthase
MEPFEIMVSESQERMLCVVEAERVAEVIAVCERWETTATAIGEVTDTRLVRVLDGDRVVGEMPVEALVDDCPLLDLEPARPPQQIYPRPHRSLPRTERALPSEEPAEVLLALLGSPNIADRTPLFEQYDCLVGSRTVLALPPRGDARPAIAVAIDGNGRRVACDPYRGSFQTVLECAANLACVGARPLGLTNCLNFGNPEKPHVAWQLTEAVRGLGDACRALEVPVVGGNVSLYNEAPEGPIYPTPVVGMVGELPDAERAGQLAFAREGDLIALVGPFTPDLHGSELAKLGGAELPTRLADVNVDAALDAHDAVRDAVRAGALSSAHDVAEGGLAVALAECCLAGGIGADVHIGGTTHGPLALLFGEGPGGFIVSGPGEVLDELAKRTRMRPIGEVGGDSLRISAAHRELGLSLAQLRQAYAALAAAFS